MGIGADAGTDDHAGLRAGESSDRRAARASQRSTAKVTPLMLKCAAQLALLLLLAGCGYHNNSGSSDGYHWSSTYRRDVRTVAVPIFTSVSYQRGVEFALSK